jgi:F420-dependent oxidoreductase-like protein
MKVGLLAPQGWKGEYDGWDPAVAWARTIELAKQAEALGFESLWAFDHFHTVPEPTDEITFESFSVLTALAMVTDRVRLGHAVICTSFRNPALTAKLASTIDVISGGRFEVGIGAGWKKDEWLAYGYGFPPIGERISTFEEHLEVITRMHAPSHASYEGERVHVRDAINEPRGVQDHIPLMVGGNGRVRTAGLAVQFADELNFVFTGPDETAERMADVRAMCEATGRDPASLRFSVYTLDEDFIEQGQPRVDLIGAFADVGVDRIMCFPTKVDPSLEAQARFAEDVVAAGVPLGPGVTLAG